MRQAGPHNPASSCACRYRSARIQKPFAWDVSWIAHEPAPAPWRRETVVPPPFPSLEERFASVALYVSGSWKLSAFELKRNAVDDLVNQRLESVFVPSPGLIHGIH